MKKSVFDDKNFFKSHQLKKNGELLLKAIPEMPVNNINNNTLEKTIPIEITKFKNKTENLFKEIDFLMKEIIEKKGLTNSKFLINQYCEFKSSLQYCLNDLIKYPKNEKRDIMKNQIL